MISTRFHKQIKRIAFIAGGTVIIGLAFGPLIGRAIGAAGGGEHGAKLIALGMKFDGADTCKGAKCHSKGDSATPPQARGNENDIWHEQDPHSKAFTTLKDDKSKAIGTKLSIADVTTSDECLSCHALNAPANLRGTKFSLAEGNTCTSCHGPSEKWLNPHQTKGWVDQQRTANKDHDALLKATGLYDTRPAMARAELCVGCHLAMDQKLVDAGHPQPKFELYYYTEFNPKNDSQAWKHWTTDTGKIHTAKIWLAGQAACTKDAMEQLAARSAAKAGDKAVMSAYEQALSHATVFANAAKAAGVGDMTAAVAAVKAAKGDAGKLGPAATAAAGEAMKMFDKINGMEPNAAAGKSMLAAVASTKGLVADAGEDGHAQMAYGIYALASAVETEAGKDQAAVDEMVGPLFPDPANPVAADAFEKTLAEIVAKLPK